MPRSALPGSAAVLGRAAGLGMILVFLLLYDPSTRGAVDLIALACLPAGAWLVLRTASALALTAALIAAVHADPGAADPWTSLVCPAVALGATVWLVIGLSRRFRRQILHTRHARWARRRP